MGVGLRFKTCVFLSCRAWLGVGYGYAIVFGFVWCCVVTWFGWVFSGFGVNVGWFSLVVCTVGFTIVVGACGFWRWCRVDIIY